MKRRIIPLVILAVAHALACSGELQFTEPGPSYKVQLTANDGNRIVELPAEKYVAAVLAGESSLFRSAESRKAMAVAARTFAASQRGRHAAQGFDFCATTHCQRVETRDIRDELRQAAEATAGELLWYAGKPAFAVYTRDCGGRTENAAAAWPDVRAPYLIAHSDPYCTRHGPDRWVWTGRPEQIVRALRESGLRSPDHLQHITTLQGRLQLSDDRVSIPISASSFRFAICRSLGWNTLRSDRYQIEISNGRIVFHGTGEGHGFGLCQKGADEMGLEGFSYREILAFYYPGTTLSRNGAGLRWTRLGGDGVAVLTTRPDRDAGLLPVAERFKNNLEAQLRIASPREITVRVYPDVDTFRNATGEPGWVAARASGSKIDIQPNGSVPQTLRHEIAHVLIEREAVPGLPIWFREGLVGWISQGGGPAGPLPDVAGRPIDDRDLRQRQDRERARRAYQRAVSRVTALVNRYGEDTVVGWVKGGLPAGL